MHPAGEPALEWEPILHDSCELENATPLDPGAHVYCSNVSNMSGVKTLHVYFQFNELV
jgi:hypothetical protein